MVGTKNLVGEILDTSINSCDLVCRLETLPKIPVPGFVQMGSNHSHSTVVIDSAGLEFRKNLPPGTLHFEKLLASCAHGSLGHQNDSIRPSSRPRVGGHHNRFPLVTLDSSAARALRCAPEHGVEHGPGLVSHMDRLGRRVHPSLARELSLAPHRTTGPSQSFWSCSAAFLGGAEPRSGHFERGHFILLSILHLGHVSGKQIQQAPFHGSTHWSWVFT